MIRLEKFSSTHYANLISWVNNEEELMQFAGPAYSFPLTARQLDESLSDTNRYAFIVVDVDTNKNIGHCELYLKDISFHLGRILIGDKNQRGKGIGQQIVTALLEFGFKNFDKTTAELNVFDWNVAAIECYKKVGFSINPDKKIERKIHDKTWMAINMALEKTLWSETNN